MITFVNSFIHSGYLYSFLSRTFSVKVKDPPPVTYIMTMYVIMASHRFMKVVGNRIRL